MNNKRESTMRLAEAARRIVAASAGEPIITLTKVMMEKEGCGYDAARRHIIRATRIVSPSPPFVLAWLKQDAAGEGCPDCVSCGQPSAGWFAVDSRLQLSGPFCAGCADS